MRQTKIDTLFKEKAKGKLKGVGSRFSACSLIKLRFSILLLGKLVNNPSLSVFQSNLKWILPALPTLNLLSTQRFFLLMNLQLFAHKLIK